MLTPEPTDSLESIIASLQPLFKNAETKGLLFFSPYQDLWFTPEELRSENAEGRFLWGPVNWQLRHPREAPPKVRSIARRTRLLRFLNRILLP